MRSVYIFLLLVFCGCQNESAGSSAKTDNKKYLNLCFSQPVSSIDPLRTNVPTADVVSMLFEGLVRKDASGKIKNAIAKDYTVSDDFTVYTFSLKETVWTDSQPLTAYDFEYAWKRALDPEVLSFGVQYLYIIKNAQKAVLGECSLDSVGVSAIDDLTLKVELEAPCPYFFESLTSSVFFPLPQHVVKSDPMWKVCQNGAFVSNGPFRLKEWKYGEFITVEKNNVYWDKNGVRIPGIKALFIREAMTQFFMFQKGDVDFLGGVLNVLPLHLEKSLKKTYPSFKTTASAKINWYFINTSVFPFNYPKLRKALSIGLDKQEIVDAQYAVTGQVSHGPLPPCFKNIIEEDSLCYNRQVAKQLLNEALQELGLTLEELPAFRIRTTPVSGQAQLSAQIMHSNYTKDLGLDCSIVVSGWMEHFAAIQKGDYEIGGMGWRSLIFDPIYILNTFCDADNPINMSNWESREYQQIVDQYSIEMNMETRDQLLKRAEKILIEECPVMPVAFAEYFSVSQDGVEGIVTHPTGLIDFKYTSFQ